MTTTELHIELDILLQKINSHYNKNILPQEKDIFINKGIMSFINTRINPRSNIRGLGFDNTVKRLEELNPLIVTKSIDIIFKNNNIYYNLPLDYLGYINSSINTKCYNAKPNLITKSNYSYRLFKLTNSFDKENLKLSISFDNTDYELFNSSEVPTEAYNNIDIYSLPTDFLINNILNISINKNLKKLKGLYENDKQLQSIEFGFDNKSESFLFKSNYSFKITKVTEGKQFISKSDKEDYLTIEDSSVLYSEGNLVERDYLRQILNNSLTSKNTQSIVCHRDSNNVSLYIDKKSKFFPIKVELTYLKKPTKVSAILDSNSELNDETLIEILASVDRNIKGVLSMDSYDKTINESILIE